MRSSMGYTASTMTLMYKVSDGLKQLTENGAGDLITRRLQSLA